MFLKAHRSILMINRCKSQGTCSGERVYGAMHPPLDLTSGHQMASLTLTKWENFKNCPNLEKKPSKRGKIFNPGNMA